MGGRRGPYMRYIYHPSVFFYERCLTDGKFLPPPPPTKRKERQKKKKKRQKSNTRPYPHDIMPQQLSHPFYQLKKLGKSFVGHFNTTVVFN
jgi:hypothetical protein